MQNRIDVFEFEKIYWDKFMNDKNFPDEYYEPLNRLLTDIDEFEPDEELRGDDTVGDSLSEEDLRGCAKKGLKTNYTFKIVVPTKIKIYYDIMRANPHPNKRKPRCRKIMHKRLLSSSLYIVLHRENIRLDI